MQALAELKNGKCISTTYTNMSTHLEWGCEHGHRWCALPSNISRGKWCPICQKKKKIKVLFNTK